jgi:hypothetical protein
MRAKRLNVSPGLLLIAGIVNFLILTVSFETFESTSVEHEFVSGSVYMTKGTVHKYRLPVFALPQHKARFFSCLTVDLMLLAFLVWRGLFYESPLDERGLLSIDGEPLKGELLMPIQAIEFKPPLESPSAAPPASTS